MTPQPRRASLLRSLLIALMISLVVAPSAWSADADKIFARDNLVAWCIVPFDAKKRGPEERAAMLERLGIKHFAYDWRGGDGAAVCAGAVALQKHHPERTAGGVFTTPPA